MPSHSAPPQPPLDVCAPPPPPSGSKGRFGSTHAAGAIFSDLTSHRRGHVVDQDNEDGGQITIIKAHAPLSAVLTYHRDLKSQSAGEGSYTMKLSHYAQVPMNEQQKVLAQYGKKHDDE